MKTDVVYEVTDFRDHAPLSGLKVLVVRNGDITVYAPDGVGAYTTLEFDDEDPDTFKDDEKNGSLRITLDGGDVVFNKLTLPLWSQIGGNFTDGAPSFKTESELYSYLGAIF